jgi:hypothetical protein
MIALLALSGLLECPENFRKQGWEEVKRGRWSGRVRDWKLALG